MEYFTDIWNILGPFGTFCVTFGTFFPVSVSCTKKNLATLVTIGSSAFVWHGCHEKRALFTLSDGSSFAMKYKFIFLVFLPPILFQDPPLHKGLAIRTDVAFYQGDRMSL
jgi:hypothetical protein